MARIRFKRPLFRRKLYISGEHYFIQKDRELGEKDLENLVDTGKNEGCWLFDIQRSRWFNLKIDNTRTYCAVTTIVPSLSGFGEISHYHTHPKHFEYQERELFLEHFQEPGQWIKNIVRNFVAISISTPSNGDIKAYSTILKVTPDHPVDFRIASPYGVMILEFDKATDTNEVTERYREVHNNDKRLTEIAASVINPKQAISIAVHSINQHMQGIFTLSMEYKLGDIK